MHSTWKCAAECWWKGNSMIWKPFFFLLLAPLSGAMDGANADLNEHYKLALPQAVRFEAVSGAPYVRGYGADGNLVGWAAISTDVTDIKGYSGKPIHVMVAITPDKFFIAIMVLNNPAGL